MQAISVKCLSVLVTRVQESRVVDVAEKLCERLLGGDDDLRYAYLQPHDPPPHRTPKAAQTEKGDQNRKPQPQLKQGPKPKPRTEACANTEARDQNGNPEPKLKKRTKTEAWNQNRVHRTRIEGATAAGAGIMHICSPCMEPMHSTCHA